MSKETTKSVKKAYDEYRIVARGYIYNLMHPAQRQLLSLEATNESGQVNAMTILELLTVVNLTDGTGDRVFLTANGKTLTLWSEKKLSVLPSELVNASYEPKGK